MFNRPFAKGHAAISGNAGMIFALCSIPLLVYVAFTIDSARQVVTDRHVQAALDAASLAGARSLRDPTLSDVQIETLVGDTFDANLETAHADLSCADEAVTIDRVGGTVKVEADCKVPSMIGAPLTPDVLRITNISMAQSSLSKLDLAMMVDVSDSMNAQRMEALKKAAKDTARGLMSLSANGGVRVSLVPYSSSVNAGKFGNPSMGLPDHADPGGDGLDKACVTERVGVAARRDDKPGPGKWIRREAIRCPDTPVTPLTNDIDVFDTAVDALVADGLTAGHLGVAWSWYSISPKWKDIRPTDSAPHEYTDLGVQKAVILMTDGNFNWSYESTLGLSNPQAKRLCREMRANGVIVYGVTFHAPFSAQQTLRNCAGSDKRFFDTDSDEDLLEAYAEIASQLSALTLRE